jgi:hypothetical protein
MPSPLLDEYIDWASARQFDGSAIAMISIDIPGFGKLELAHLAIDALELLRNPKRLFATLRS